MIGPYGLNKIYKLFIMNVNCNQGNQTKYFTDTFTYLASICKHIEKNAAVFSGVCCSWNLLFKWLQLQ